MLRLAWRNVWRNGRRSLINVAAMGFGLAAIMFGLFGFLIFQMLWPALALAVATLVMFGIWMWPKPMKGEL